MPQAFDYYDTDFSEKLHHSSVPLSICLKIWGFFFFFG